MNLILILITVLISMITAVYLFSKWNYSYWKRNGVHQLEPEFFYGDTKEMVKGNRSIADAVLDFYRKFKALGLKYGGIYIIFKKAFVPIDPDLIKDIMQKKFEHFSAHLYVPYPTITTMGLFHLNGEPWKDTRRTLTPTFTSGKMKMMFEYILEKTSGLVELSGKMAKSGEPVKIKEILGRFTSDVIGSCGFGIECNCLENPESVFYKHGSNILSPPEKKSTLFGLLLRILKGKEVRNEKDLSESENFFKNIVMETIDYREKNNIIRKDFMHLMIQLRNRGVITDDEHIFNKSDKAGNTLSIDELTAQCLLFFVAGYETSATTMTFVLLELAQNQNIQQKVREEANLIFEKYNGKMTYEAMMELTYTEKVIQETLRKFPPIPSIPRICTKSYNIPDTDTVIEKGTLVLIPVWGLHTDPEHFPNPEKFDPERFSPENKSNIRDYTYLPFGEGPRICLGIRFGLMQSKIGVFSLVKNYNFTLHQKTKFPLKMQRDNVILSVDGDVWLNITKVNK